MRWFKSLTTWKSCIKRNFLMKWKSVIACMLFLLTLFVFHTSSKEYLSNYVQISKHVEMLSRNVSTIQEQDHLVSLEKYTDELHDIVTTSGGLYFTNTDNSIHIPNGTKVQTFKRDASLLVKSDIGHESVVQESEEFPGMPDPCMKPRRKTEVEDILCMKRPVFSVEYKNPCWREEEQFYCLPYFHLIGFPKCGTTDLFKRLLLHPDIVPNFGRFGKETWYWSWKRFAVNRGWDLKHGMTLKEFAMHFDAEVIRTKVNSQGRHTRITGHGDPMDSYDRFNEEATPQNIPGAEELLWTTPFSIRRINPNIKLLLMTRDPVERLYSHYFFINNGSSAHIFHEHVVQSLILWKECVQHHSIRHCIYSPELKKTLKVPIYVSFYIVHLKEWLKAFPREQIFIFRNEDYSVNITETLIQIFKFLDIG
ncbi:carbohydrate sulfotransferase 15-like [Ruditapes philippinarum]|uniref:carbohydrate sulfotransferase 15-like n=1 Tax=Ruditapes philippinarum TaxID=129788 RepID=UPI00295BCDE1|nr:carbohydrate sulfotransferase 15-like [Ruditapes philippinarum]